MKQLDFKLANYTFSGLQVPDAILHFRKLAFDDTYHATIDVVIYASAEQQARGVPLTTAEWGYATEDSQTTADVFASLLTHPDAGPILAGAAPVGGQ